MHLKAFDHLCFPASFAGIVPEGSHTLKIPSRVGHLNCKKNKKISLASFIPLRSLKSQCLESITNQRLLHILSYSNLNIFHWYLVKNLSMSLWNIQFIGFSSSSVHEQWTSAAPPELHYRGLNTFARQCKSSSRSRFYWRRNQTHSCFPAVLPQQVWTLQTAGPRRLLQHGYSIRSLLFLLKNRQHKSRCSRHVFGEERFVLTLLRKRLNNSAWHILFLANTKSPDVSFCQTTEPTGGLWVTVA